MLLPQQRPGKPKRLKRTAWQTDFGNLPYPQMKFSLAALALF
jgi:hypothetical protein